MILINIFLVLFGLTTLTVNVAAQTAKCTGPGWTVYKDTQKCIKLIEKRVIRKEALAICAQESNIEQSNSATSSSHPPPPQLLTIESQAQQDFLTEYLFTQNGLKSNVWIGAKRFTPSMGADYFVWEDGSKVAFSSWANDYPTTVRERPCVAMAIDAGGNWKDLICQMEYYTVCQRDMHDNEKPWSLEKLTEEFLESRKEITDANTQIKELKKDVTDFGNQIKDLKKDVTEFGNQIKDLKKNVTESGNQVTELKIDVGDIRTNITNEIKIADTHFRQLEDEVLDTRTNFTIELNRTNNKIGLLEGAVENTRTSLSRLDSDLEIANENIDQLRANSTRLPIGFIYAQLQNEKSPVELFGPGMAWTDVSADYAGLFFRVIGNGSEEFGKIQEENSPRMVQFISGLEQDMPTVYAGAGRNVSIASDGWSEAFLTGYFADVQEEVNPAFINFKHSGGEVRPRNMAICVWKRTA